MMRDKPNKKIFDLPALRNRTRVFRDRSSAGKVLAEMLKIYRGSSAPVLAIPAGGVAVGAAAARELDLALDLVVVSKITPLWNSEVGYGAVAFDGTVMLNKGFLLRFNLDEKEIQDGITRTKQKVLRRVKTLRGDRPCPDLRNPVILVDDGLASGFTLRVAVEALRKAGSSEIILAVPTGHEESVEAMVDEVEAIYCPNLRSGYSFAVADAYEQWKDLDEDEVLKILKDLGWKIVLP